MVVSWMHVLSLAQLKMQGSWEPPKEIQAGQSDHSRQSSGKLAFSASGPCQQKKCINAYRLTFLKETPNCRLLGLWVHRQRPLASISLTARIESNDILLAQITKYALSWNPGHEWLGFKLTRATLHFILMFSFLNHKLIIASYVGYLLWQTVERKKLHLIKCKN